MKRKSIPALLLALALLTGAAAAQETTGSIGGRVVDTPAAEPFDLWTEVAA